MITVLRTKPLFHRISAVPSWRSTAPSAAGAASLRMMRAGMVAVMGGLLGRDARSVMGGLVGEQQVVDLLFELAGAAVLGRDLVDVAHLGLTRPGWGESRGCGCRS